MFKLAMLAALAASLSGCYPERGRAYLDCMHQYPKSDAQNALVAFGAVGGLAAGLSDDGNKQAREQCFKDHGID